MSLANTLSVLLKFQTDVEPVRRAQAFLEGHFKKVGEFNKQLQNGTAALNNVLQAGAALFAGNALRSYSREALEARAAQQQLNQALEKAGQNTADYRAELAATASAQERLTGVQGETIAAVQRELVFGRLQRKDMADFTRLTLDFAAAKNVDAVGASKAVARALMGEGDELKRYGVEIDSSKDKIAALREGLGKFSGQAERAFASMPEGMRQFTVASRGARETFGDLVLEVSSPFLAALSSGLERATGWMEEMRDEGSLLISVMQGISRTFGEFVGSSAGAVFLAIAGGLLAMKAAAFVASPAIAMLAGGFMFFTGANIVQVLTNLWQLSRGIGLLKVLAASDWPTRLAAGITAIGGALAALAIGAAVINAVEAAQLARIEREERIRDVIHEQTRALHKQAQNVRTWDDVRAVRVEAERRVTETRGKIAELEKKEAADRQALIDASRGRGDRTPKRTLTDDEQVQLDMLRQQLGWQEQFLKTTKTREWTEAKLAESKRKQAEADERSAAAALKEKLPELRQRADEQNLANLAPADRAAELQRRRAGLEKQLARVPLADEAKRLDLQVKIEDLNQKIRESLEQQAVLVREANEKGAEKEKQQREKLAERTELADKRALFDLETAIQEAQADGNQELLDKLTRERRERELLNELGRDAIDIIQVRLDIEDELEKRRRAREEEERAMAARLGQLAVDRAAIESDRFLNDEEKRRRILPLLQEEGRILAQRIKHLEREMELTADAAAKRQISGQIDSLRGQAAGNRSDQSDAAPRTIAGEITAAAIQMQNQIGSIAQQLRGVFTSVAETARTSLGGALSDMILKATSFKDAMLGFGNAIVVSFVNSGAQIVADWFMNHVVMANVRRAFNAARVTEEAVTTGAEVSIHTSGELAKTGATAAGTGARKGLAIAETVFHGVQWVIRNAIHLAGEVMNTGITMAQQAIRLPLLIVESGVYLAKAAIAAMSAMASIPYVGPFLAIAAMGAILAAGGKLLGGFAEGGIARGPGTGTSDSIVTRVSDGEAITRARVVANLGEPFFEDLNRGVVNLGALPDHIAAGLTLPDYGAAGNAEMVGSGRSRGNRANMGGGARETVIERNIILVDSPEAAARAQRKFTDARVEHIGRKRMGRRIR